MQSGWNTFDKPLHLQVKAVFLISIAIFEIGSLICAIAPSSSVFIVGRAIAGIGAGGIFSGAFVIGAHSRACFPYLPFPLLDNRVQQFLYRACTSLQLSS
jgi:MFS family permease